MGSPVCDHASGDSFVWLPFMEAKLKDGCRKVRGTVSKALKIPRQARIGKLNHRAARQLHRRSRFLATAYARFSTFTRYRPLGP